VPDTPAISQRIAPKGVVSIQSEIDYQLTQASQVDTGWLEREARLANYVFQ
jgi:hypothetical protein